MSRSRQSQVDVVGLTTEVTENVLATLRGELSNDRDAFRETQERERELLSVRPSRSRRSNSSIPWGIERKVTRPVQPRHNSVPTTESTVYKHSYKKNGSNMSVVRRSFRPTPESWRHPSSSRITMVCDVKLSLV